MLELKCEHIISQYSWKTRKISYSLCKSNFADLFFEYYLFIYLAAQGLLWHVGSSSPTRDQTEGLSIESSES